MAKLPDTRAEALARADAIARLPVYHGTFLSDAQRSVALQIPVADRQDSHRIAQALREKAAELKAGSTYSFTGLPVAQAQFGIEMFLQMAIAAPAAMALIFVLLLAIFRSGLVALAPMAVAMVSTIATMGALILTGQTVHIMSSMIPIFVMPIAVMDAIHILSDFAEHRRQGRSRQTALREVYGEPAKAIGRNALVLGVGFLPLLASPLVPYQTVGVLIPAILWIAAIATLLLLGALVKLLHRWLFRPARMPARRVTGLS